MPSPERICIELIKDARDHSPDARVLNYVRLIEARRDKVYLKDEVSGEVFEVKPMIVVNAAGPWIDFVNGNLGKPSRFIGGTKGSHLVLDNPDLRIAIGDCELFFENKDGRIVLIYPLKDKVLVGSSDIRVDDPDTARCTEEEIDYFFEMVTKVFPTIKLNRTQIVFRFSGVRPLPYTDEGSTGQISRDHSIRVIAPGNGIDFPVISLIGGKWTTFRAFSEVVTNKVLDYFHERRKIDTRSLPFGGGRDFPKTEDKKALLFSQAINQTGLQHERVKQLLERYGTKAKDLAQYLSMGEDQSLKTNQEYSRREIVYLVDNEDVIHLDDLILRRTMLAKLGQLTPDLLNELVAIVGETLGWNFKKQVSEIDRTKKILIDKHGVDLGG
jgi:glycerol-3-phosphate dehydrogenase